MCLAIDKIRPCTPEKLLAYMYLNKQGLSEYMPSRTQDQQKYVDETTGPIRPVRPKKRRVEPEPVEEAEPELAEIFEDEELPEPTSPIGDEELLEPDEVVLPPTDKELPDIPELDPMQRTGISSGSGEWLQQAPLAEHFQKTGTSGRESTFFAG